jgi:hypothetical protein
MEFEEYFKKCGKDKSVSLRFFCLFVSLRCRPPKSPELPPWVRGIKFMNLRNAQAIHIQLFTTHSISVRPRSLTIHSSDAIDLAAASISSWNKARPCIGATNSIPWAAQPYVPHDGGGSRDGGIPKRTAASSSREIAKPAAHSSFTS